MEKIIVRGRLTDFNGSPLKEGEVLFNDDNFKAIFSTKTDSEGQFEVEIEQRTYPSVFICKDYKIKHLEFWHWNFNPRKDDFLEVKIDGLELYGIKAWETNPTYPGIIIFFRPMSLKKYKELGELNKNTPILIAPNLGIEDLRIAVDGKLAKIIGLNKVKEHISAEQYMEAYLAHISIEGMAPNLKRITIICKDPETLEQGMANFDLN